MNEITEKSLAQIVTNNHRAAAVFEKYHLDFCCKGKRSLMQACEEKQLNITEIVAELNMAEQHNSAKAVIDLNQQSLSQLADHIVTHHHQYVKNEMPAIAGYLQKIAAKHGSRHPEMLNVFEVFTALKEEMDMHMHKEEAVLFPRIKEMEALLTAGNQPTVQVTYLKAPIGMMEQEHDHAGTAMAAIRELTGNYILPEDACTTYKLSFAALEAFERDLHQHIHLENNLLFPKALDMFKQIETVQYN
ncbi:MAG: iron-sulfur cluster repair di-iron protein [Chitinophagaceae bacterium]|nr:iron-sulfur cluster repair di-iron protein [Chitinophagaceae bacterium]